MEDEPEQDDLESALGFMFDSLHSKTWKVFDLPRQIQVKIQHIDDHPGHVQSGLYLWPAAEYACHHLASVWDQFQPKSIVELGAGCGLASIYASKLGGLQLAILTDYDRGCIELLQNNVQANLASRVPISNLNSDKDANEDAKVANLEHLDCVFHCQVFKWGTDVTPLLRLLTSSTSMTTETSGSERGVQRDDKPICDMIIGTDLLYCVDVVSVLLLSVSQLLSLRPTIGGTAGKSVFILVSSFDIGENIEKEVTRHSEALGLVREEIVPLDTSRYQCRVQYFRLKSNT